MRPRKLDTQQVVGLYTVQHLTCEEIGRIFGTSKVAVWKTLRKAGVQREQGTWIEVPCAWCGAELRRPRSKARKALKQYCNPECYYAALDNPDYRQNRQGQRIARSIVAQYFKLEPDHVVHHVDGDNRNNDRANLMVFANQSDHMAHHRGRKIAPLWCGVSE